MLKLDYYINNIEQLYANARLAYNKEFEDFGIKQRQHADKMPKLNSEGAREETLRFEQARKKHEEQLEAIRAEFEAKANDERIKVEKVFGSFYGVGGDTNKVDNDIVTLLNQDVYSETEILSLADKYLSERNIYMYRIIGKRAEKGASKELQQLANNAKRISHRSDLDIIDNFVFVCNKGLRSEKHLADGIDRQLHKNSYDRSINECEGIEV